jgi:glycosyltransferase involved in cell wall biosynthesis
MGAVTLLMPIRNGEKFLGQAKKGLLSNCGEFDEILIINDGSTDSTELILNSWKLENRNIRIINNSKSAGLVEALNFGISESSNKWIARFDVDDSYSSDRVIKAKNLNVNNCVAIFSDYSFLSERNKPLGFMPSAVFRNQTYLSLVSSQRTAHPSVFFNKEAVLEVGCYRKEDYPAEDISLWLRLSKIGELETIPNETVKYRISRNSVTGQARSKSLSIKNSLISKFNFRQDIIQECLDSIETTAQMYEQFEYSGERFLLHIRDLLILEKLGKINGTNHLRFQYIMKLISRPKLALPSIKILSEAAMRRIYRGMIS